MMANYLAGVKRGDFSNEWVDRLLQEAGCVIVPRAKSEKAA